MLQQGWHRQLGAAVQSMQFDSSGAGCDKMQVFTFCTALTPTTLGSAMLNLFDETSRSVSDCGSVSKNLSVSAN